MKLPYIFSAQDKVTCHIALCASLLVGFPLSTHAQQASLNGEVVNLPIVVVNDQFYQVELSIIPQTDPPEFDVKEGYLITNVESEVEYKSGVSGTWAISENVSIQDCDVEPYFESYNVDVVRTGDAIFVSTSVGDFNGTISGNTLIWSGSFDDDGGVLSTSINVVFSPQGNSLSGSASITWSDGEINCSGNSIVNGELLYPEETPYSDITSSDPSMPAILTAVDQSASIFDGSILTIPAISVDGTNFWAELILISDNPIRFRLRRAGFSDISMGLTFSEFDQAINGAVFYSERSGNAELIVDQQTGLLQKLLVDDEYYLFVNYTSSTVDIIRLKMGEETVVIPDVALPEQVIAYIDEITSVSEASFSIAALSIEAEVGLDLLKQAVDFAGPILEKAREKDSFTIREALIDKLKGFSKSLAYSMAAGNIDAGTAAQIDKVFDAIQAMSTKFSCFTPPPNIFSCYEYFANKSDIEKDLDAFSLTIKDAMEEAKQKITDAHELAMAAQLGCDDFYQGNQAAINECHEQLGTGASGKDETVIDFDRDNNGVADYQQQDNGCPECTALLETLNQIKEDSLEPVGYCVDHEGTDELWEAGCYNSQDQRTGVWTSFWHAWGKYQTITYLNGLKHGLYSTNYDTSKEVIKSEAYYKNDKLDGTVTEYWNGELDKTETYVEGVRHGPWSDYYPNNHNDRGDTGEYVDGNRDGDWQRYVDGKLHSTITYAAGVFIKTSVLLMFTNDALTDLDA